MATTRRVKLVRYAATNVDYDYLGAYRLKVVVEEAEGLDKELFLFLRRPVDPYTGDVLDEFVTICSPVDLADWPIGEPDPDLPSAFFRKAEMEIDLRTTELAQRVWEEIVRQVDLLCEAASRLEELQVLEEHWCCAESPTDSASSASSESLSAGSSS